MGKAPLKERLKNLFQFKKKQNNKPVRALLETTNKCNLSCPFCMVGQSNSLLEIYGDASHENMSREAGMMSEEVFNAAASQMIEFGIKKVYLHFQGEPFLNKNIVNYAKTLKDKKFKVVIFTNGLAFGNETIKRLANVEIDLLRFSVDGASEETYQLNRVGGKFNSVYENMKEVVRLHKNKKTRLEWQFIVMKNNQHEIEKARSLALDIGINFNLKGFRESVPSLVSTIPEYMASKHKKPCRDIYDQIGIYWDGSIVPCCYDTDGEEVMGNILEDTLSNIWNSKNYILFREKINGFAESPELEPNLCKDCLRWE